MISEDTSVIAVEISESDLQPSFTYAETDDQQLNDLHAPYSCECMQLSFDNHFFD